MDRGLWWATVHKVTKSDTTEATQPLLPAIWGQILFLDCLPSEFLVHRNGWQLWQMASSCIPPPQAPQQSVWGVRGEGVGGWWHLLDCRQCVPFLETSFTFGGLKSLMAVTFLAHHMAENIPFHLGLFY